MPTFSAVLLAGGKSQRMGRDKALLQLPGSDLLLWQRQLHVLEELEPLEIFWSGPARADMPKNVRLVSDVLGNAGPLAGVSACLAAVATDLLIVLAIDLPRMDAAYLKQMACHCTPIRGVVPKLGDNLEPLAAIYPVLLRDLAEDHLDQGRFAMQDFVREAEQRELISTVAVGSQDAAKFKNVNTPHDLEGFA